MADLRSNFVGIKSPNPFWLASAPPTDKEYNVRRAYEAGWGGVVWKTLGEDPPVVNVSGPRYGTLMGPDRHVNGLNNIELITDRTLDINLEEIARVKRNWPPATPSRSTPPQSPAWSRQSDGHNPITSRWRFSTCAASPMQPQPHRRRI